MVKFVTTTQPFIFGRKAISVGPSFLTGETTTGPAVLFRDGIPVKDVSDVQAQAFFSGTSTAPFQGSIRTPSGDFVLVTSKRGQQALAVHQAGLAAALRKEPAFVTGGAVSFVGKPPVPIPIEKVVKPSGTRVGTRITGGVTFAVVSQGVGRPATLIEETAFLQQREFETARELGTRQAALGQQAIEQASLRKQLEVRRRELERLSRSQVVPPAFLRKKILEFEALGGEFEVSQALRKKLVSGFRVGEKKFEKTQEQLAGIAEAKRIVGILTEREKGVPIEEQFGVESIETTKLIAKRVSEQRARVLGAGLVGSAQQFALEKQKLRDIQKKAGFSTEGKLGFLGITEAERQAFPIIAESLARKQRPGIERSKFLLEAGGIPAAFFPTARLIGRKATETALDLFAPGTEEALGLLLPKEATPTINLTKALLGLEGLEAGQQFALFGGTRGEFIERGGAAFETLAELATFQLALGAITGKLFKVPKASLGLGEAGIIGKTKKKLSFTRITKAESIRLRKLGVIVEPTVTELKFPKITTAAAKQLKELKFVALKEPTFVGAAPPSGTLAITIPKTKTIITRPRITPVPVTAKLAAREQQFQRALALRKILIKEKILSEASLEKLFKLPKTKVKITSPVKAKVIAKQLEVTIEKVSLAERQRLQTAVKQAQQNIFGLGTIPNIAVLAKQQQREILKEAEKQRSLSALIVSQPQAVKQAERLAQRQVEKQREKHLTTLGITQPLALMQAERILQRQRERTAVAILFDFPDLTKTQILQRVGKATSISFEDTAREKPPTRKPKRFIPPTFKEKSGITKQQLETFVQGFAIFERRRGKFQRIGTGVFPEIAALAKAFKRAEETAAVTVKIVPTGAKVKPSKAIDVKEFFKLRSRFRLAKGGTFQELRKFRISTKGELAEITFAPRKAKAIKIKAIKNLIPTFSKSKGGLSIL